MTAPAAPHITTHFDGDQLYVRWQPVPTATDYRFYAADESFVDILAEEFGVTGEADTDLLTTVAHGLSDDDLITFPSLTGGTGLDEDVPYFVIVADADTFQVATEAGGSAVAFDDDVTDGTWHLLTPPARLLEQEVADDEVDDSGWFHLVFTPAPIAYVTLTALNIDVEESSDSNEAFVISGGGGTSYGKAAPPQSPRNTKDPFGAL